jgi:hypothetical protein
MLLASWRLSERAPPAASRSGLRPSNGRPFLSPATIRERFHRDNRGVQVLSAWLAEKGGSPAFFRTVNQIIAEDQNIEPLITGLINVSAVLAHMTAGALGASAEGLIAGLLDIYGQFDRPDTSDTSPNTRGDAE